MTGTTYENITELANADNTILTNDTNTVNVQNSALTADVESKNTLLMEKQQIQDSQMKEIENKEKLLLTRARMLQISQDRNSYKTKIVYALLAILIVIFIINLFIWSLKKKYNAN